MTHSLLRTLRFVVLASLTLPADQAPAAWRQFRGDRGLGIDTNATFAGGGKEVWRTPLPGPGTSSPIVSDGKIFLSCYSGYDSGAESVDGLQLHALCLAATDGRVFWDKTMPATLPEQGRIRENHGYASSTPVADAQGVYFFFGRSGVYAFDLDGQVRWHTEVGTNLSGWGSAASPILYRDLVIINASVESKALVALDKSNGKEVWRTPGIVESWNTPLLVELAKGQTELVVGILGKVLGLDPATGGKLWECDTGIRWYMCPSAVAHEGVVYFIGGRSGDGLAVRAGGRGKVTATHLVWKISKGSNVSSPLYHDGHVYFAHENLGILYCVNAENGAMVYEERLNPAPGQIYASPVLLKDHIFYLSRGGQALLVPARPKWEGAARHELGRGVYNASPAVDAGRLLIRTDRDLRCLSGQSRD